MLEVSMSHLFVYLAEYNKVQDKIDEQEEGLFSFLAAFWGDTEGLEHSGLENKMFSRF